jgi:hypothetical protein
VLRGCGALTEHAIVAPLYHRWANGKGQVGTPAGPYHSRRIDLPERPRRWETTGGPFEVSLAEEMANRAAGELPAESFQPTADEHTGCTPDGLYCLVVQPL